MVTNLYYNNVSKPNNVLLYFFLLNKLNTVVKQEIMYPFTVCVNRKVVLITNWLYISLESLMIPKGQSEYLSQWPNDKKKTKKTKQCSTKKLHRKYILLKTILNSGVPGGKIASSSCSTNKNQWKVIFSYWWWSKYGLWLQHTEHCFFVFFFVIWSLT